jgi:hypothetical protein
MNENMIYFIFLIFLDGFMLGLIINLNNINPYIIYLVTTFSIIVYFSLGISVLIKNNKSLSIVINNNKIKLITVLLLWALFIPLNKLVERINKLFTLYGVINK